MRSLCLEEGCESAKGPRFRNGIAFVDVDELVGVSFSRNELRLRFEVGWFDGWGWWGWLFRMGVCGVCFLKLRSDGCVLRCVLRRKMGDKTGIP